MVANDGFTYERSAIEKWLQSSVEWKSPMTGDAMDSVNLTPNHVLRSMIIGFYDANKVPV